MKLETPRSLLDDPEHPTFALKKILVPHDFSPPSRKAFKYAFRFAKEFGSHLILLHVLEPVSSRNFHGTAWGASIFRKRTDQR